MLFSINKMLSYLFGSYSKVVCRIHTATYENILDLAIRIIVCAVIFTFYLVKSKQRILRCGNEAKNYSVFVYNN